LIGLVAALAVLAWAYWPNFQYLWIIWTNEPNYSHGILVIPIALVIFWQRLKESSLDWSASRGPWWSWAVLAAILATRVLAYEQNNLWVESLTMVGATACVMLTLGGWPLLSVAWPAVVFLLFMLPLPPFLNNMLSMPLQRIATLGSVFFLQLLGFLALADGNVIHLPEASSAAKTLEVAQACNGLSMLMTLAATVAATLFLIPLSNWKRIVVLVSALPIALVSNIIRIVATGWCYQVIKDEVALRAGLRVGVMEFLYQVPLAAEGVKKFAHDLSGWMMMPVALLLVCVEVLVLSWLAADSDATETTQAPVLAVFPQGKSDKDKSVRNKDKWRVDD
jgi:exosortase